MLVLELISGVSLVGDYGRFAETDLDHHAGPVIDGDFVPDLPGKLMRQGQYNRRLTMMPGRVLDEVS